ncbi:MAG TPA: hypothetical protein VLV87_06915, partial [Gammaproteobacteria bacterium]|nr:hypothetical protein [Gammaproteobacteria bacterium]
MALSYTPGSAASWPTCRTGTLAAGDREIVYFNSAINASGPGDIYYLHVDKVNTPRLMTTSTKAIGWTWESDPWGGSAT